MSFLQNLHGALALALLLGLLLAEEAGVPLPFAPGEVVLLLGGLLAASGALNPFVFVPLAIVACVLGSVLGFSWTRIVGERGLQSLARRLRQERHLERVSRRLRSGGALGIFVARLIPGLRIYTTLAAGAAQVPRAAFLAGMVPATVIWVVVFVVLGELVGVPVEHILGQVERIALQGGILLVLGAGIILAVRRIPPASGAGLVRLPRALRILMAALIDVAVVASIVTGLLAIGRRAFGIGVGASWLDAVVALIAIAIAYVVLSRRSVGTTVGEALARTSYASGRAMVAHPRAAFRVARRALDATPAGLDRTATMLRTLGDPSRLRLLHVMLAEPRSASEVATAAGLPVADAVRELETLRDAGMIVSEPAVDVPRYTVRQDLREALTTLLAATASEPAG